MRITDSRKRTGAGQVNVAGTATQGPAVPCRGAMIRALSGNVGVVYVGYANTVTTGTGFPLAQGDPPTYFPVQNMNQLWFIAATPNDDIGYLAY